MLEYTSQTHYDSIYTTEEHFAKNACGLACLRDGVFGGRSKSNKMKIIIFRRTTYFNAPNNFHLVVFSAYLSLNIITSKLAAACAHIIFSIYTQKTRDITAFTRGKSFRATNESWEYYYIYEKCADAAFEPCRSAYHQRLKEISRRRYAKS